MVLEWILGATIAVSLVSLVGITLIGANGKWQERLMLFFFSYSAGTFLGAAFLDLIPEAHRTVTDFNILMVSTLAGIVVFFILEKAIHWHHHQYNCKDCDDKKKPVGYLTLFGSTFHNLFDGVAIAASFMAGIPTGITTTIAVILHEIPHEMSDYNLLVYSGFSQKRALALNLLTAVASILGALAFFYFAPSIDKIIGVALAFSGGMFIYMGNADLVPELHKETNPLKSGLQILFIGLGIATIWLVVTYLGV